MKNRYTNVVASISKQHGGPSHSVTGLCDALAAYGQPVTLVVQRTKQEQITDLVLPQNPDVDLVAIDAFRKLRITHSQGYKAKLLRIVSDRKTPLIHNHGLWLQCNHQSANVARELGLPYIVSPRGMMEPWALSYNAWKKKLPWLLWQKRALEQTTAFCATSAQEAESIRRLGFRQPIAVIPNGITLPQFDTESVFPSYNPRYALFLSRIHPKKGLLNLVKAWSAVKPAGWKVVIAGPDENGHRQEVQRLIDELGMHDVFDFLDQVEGTVKDELYRKASLFILPTFSENFGIVIAEALAAGTPVITTKGAPWQELETHNCGWWVDIGVEPLTQALREATELPYEKLREMGERGRKFAHDSFGWQEIGRQMLAFYEWILHGGTPPDCVRLD